jgi:membrane-associated protein
MELISWFIDVVLHLDKHLTELVADYHLWVYAILFLIIFCETGLVVTPFLPGDSLLFAVGALAAVDQTGTLHAPLIWLLLMFAAVLGNEVNFRVGRAIGPRAFSGGLRWLKQDYLIRTQQFYEKHGGKTIILSRFVPIIRTFAPFLAGVAQMSYRRFLAYNVIGGFLWIASLVYAGYLFGNIPWVKDNLTFIVLGIVVVSLIPAVTTFMQERRARKAAG